MKILISKFGVKSMYDNPHYITNALAVYCPKLPLLQGKQVRNQPPRVETGTYHIPNDFHWLHHFFTLNDGVLFFNVVSLLKTLSRKIRLVAYEHIPTQT